MDDIYSPDLWFQRLFGFQESVQKVAELLVLRELKDHAELTSKANSKTYNVGKFSLRNIPSFGSLQSVGGGKLNIIHGQSSGPIADLANVLVAQSLPECDGATFQAASNANCLEFVGSQCSAESGVTGYFWDRTQGPYCALAAGPAAVYRNYFVLHENGKRGQLSEEICIFKDTPLFPKHIVHGYVRIISEKEADELASIDWASVAPRVCVGLHENCEVTTTQCRAGFKDAPRGRIVHQVYGAAFNLGQDVKKCGATLRIGYELLAAQYRATILAGWEMSLKYPERAGSKKLFLTLLGGGVFGNPFEMICRAIASCQQLIIDSGLECYVVCFSSNTFQEVFPLLEGVMKATNGEVVGPAFQET
jgi:hypothetical protein